MSGQPYRYYTDPTKYRTLFMDTLDLQANINAMNLEANKTYKETGQLPAVSQMKETRTTSEILADTLKLKIDITQAIAKVSSQQFGQLVVQRIESHPLNIDNRLLVFTAQRIDDIVDNLKKIYKYGIKGDSNDAEQLVSFIAKMYNDKNSMTAQTKAFMDSQGLRSLSQSTNVFLNLYQYLSRLSVRIIAMNKTLNEMEQSSHTYDVEDTGGIDLTLTFIASAQITGQIASLIKTIMEALPNSQQMATAIESMVLAFAEGTDMRFQPTETRRGHLSAVQSGFDSTDSSVAGMVDEELFDELTEYLDYVNTGLPSIGLMTSFESQLDTYFKQLINSYETNLEPLYNGRPNLNEYINRVVMSGSDKAIKINVEKFIDVCNRLYGILLPNQEWTENRIKRLASIKTKIANAWNRRQGQQPTQQPTQQPNVQTPGSSSTTSMPALASSHPSTNELREIKHGIQELLDINDSLGGLTADEIDRAINLLQQLYDLDNSYDFRIIDPNEPFANIINEMESALRELGINGIGLQKRRGRPKGCGISKAKTYKEIVKKHSALDKGIIETPRFVKFGKYLVNTHRLNNEDVFALKRPSGGNIVEIPSTKISKNLSSVIKKMIGGELPTYSDISKLSEPEKAYLHKVSKKSNILDKFDIPAPSKDALEKDIHQFEVMKGEILAGNDNKDLIRKFKAHILKLSKNGTLPKREVQEILEDLLELNI